MNVDSEFYGPIKKILFSKLYEKVKLDSNKEIVSLRLIKDEEIISINSLKLGNYKDITFFENTKYIQDLKKTKSRFIILHPNYKSHVNKKASVIFSKFPRKTFSHILSILYESNYKSNKKKKISKNAFIGEGVVLGNGVEIGSRVQLGPNTVIGDNVKIGDGSILGSNCSIDFSIIGQNCVIYPGSRLGTTGFGFNFDNKGVYKFPHLGRVLIGNNVEVGANSTIDRGSIGDTVIDDYVMIDNLVHVAHNVEIGKGTVICGQSGMAGSAKIGKQVIMGAQVGITGHISIASGTILSARTGVTKSIISPGSMAGFPAVPIKEFKHQTIALRKISKRKKYKDGND